MKLLLNQHTLERSLPIASPTSMTPFQIFGFTLINLGLIDWFARLLLKNTRVTKSDKPAGLLALLILALMRKGAMLEDQPASLSRFIWSIGITLFLAAVLAVALSAPMLNELDTLSLFLSLLPFLIMPFFHLTFGLSGHKPLSIRASIKHFRLRSIVALVMAANITLALLGAPIAQAFALHASFAFLALVSVLYTIALSRAQMSFFSIDHEDSDTGPVSFFYYFCSILEFFLYCVVINRYILNPLWSQLLNNKLSTTLLFFSFLGLYCAVFIVAKILVVQRHILKLSFYERGLLPLSFVFFGLTMIVWHYY